MEEEISVAFGEPEDWEDVEEAVSNDGIKYSDEGWHDYVMSQFLPDELYNEKYPTLNGMRRVAEKLLGQIISSRVVQLNSLLDPSNTGRASCVYEIQINNFLGSHHYRTFSGAGGSYEGNTDKAYAIYPEAIAEGRAEARAYRKALLLKTVAAEEIKGNEKSFESVLPGVKEDYDENQPLSHGQKVAIGVACNRVSVDKDKLFEKYAKDNKMEIDKFTKLDGQNLMKELTEYQNKSKEVPGEIKK